MEFRANPSPIMSPRAFLFPWLAFAATASVRAEVVIHEIMYHPASENPAEEYIELYNRGDAPVVLTNWSFTSGVAFTFPAVSIPAGGYLVVAANGAAFTAMHPGVTNYVAGWVGKLSNSSNTLTLRNAQLVKMDEVDYADDGDWGQRERDHPPDFGHRGWGWSSEADGGGKSLELVSALFDNSVGQNWKPSTTVSGTPGAANSVAAADIAPIITGAAHFPLIPTHSDAVAVYAKMLDDHGTAITAALHWRLDGAGSFTTSPMFDDGMHGDGGAGDGVFGVLLPAQANGTIVEFYFQAVDATAHSRTWPAAAKDYTGTFGQYCNCLYQVDDTVYAGAQPIYRTIMKAADRTELANINSNSGAPPFPFNAGETNDQTYSHARFNTTLISNDGTGPKLRYRSGMRNRGNGSRSAQPQSFNLNFTNESGWNGIHALNLNTQNTPYQLVGSALYRQAGLAMAQSRAVQLRWNGANLASGTGAPAYGFYVCNEVQDSDFCDHHFPTDSSGNLYRGQRIDSTGGANLRDQSNNPNPALADPTPYRVNYFKQTNTSEDNWADLIGLTQKLAKGQSTAATYATAYAADYVTAIQSVVDVNQWMRFMAVNTMADNSETNISSGDGDDYYFYFGITDPRASLISYDLDTILGRSGTSNSPTHSIFLMSRADFAPNAPTPIHPFMARPEFARIYFQELQRILDGAFSATQFANTVDATLGGVVDASIISSIKAFNTSRTAYVASQLPLTLANFAAFTTGGGALTITSGFPRSTSALINLTGKADCRQTASVKINGVTGTYTPWRVTNVAAFTTSLGDWSADNVSLHPGINRILVQAFNEGNAEIERTTFDVWYDDSSVVNKSGNAVSETWTAAGGPYQITAAYTIPSAVTLTIQPGTSVYIAAGVNITVASGGKILAEGTDTSRIRFTKTPGSTNWGGLTINGGAGSPETRLAYADFDSNNGVAVTCTGSTVYLDHLNFGTTNQPYLHLDGASFLVSNCIFPNTSAAVEPVHGTGGVKSGGYGIIRDCYFGTSSGYSDIVDFTGGSRPSQALVQFYNNVFTGTTDDVLDLDGTDAWVEGNIFLHVHKNGSPDTAAAISGGQNQGAAADKSEITAIGNIFYDCDNAMTAKEGNFYTLINNTIVHQSRAGGTEERAGVVNLADDGIAQGVGAYLDGNIIMDVEALQRSYTPALTSIITFNNNILPFAWTGPGSGNSVVDPRLKYLPKLSETNFPTFQSAQVMRDWFSLLPGSPGIGSGPNGRNKGGVIPLGVSISGEPVGTTNATTATLTVATNVSGFGIPTTPWPNGSGFTHYQWNLDGGAFSAETPITTPISLSGLTNGAHTVSVIGKNDVGTYQNDSKLGSDAAITVSKSWIVNTSYIPPAATPNVRINEVLAKNVETQGFSGIFPDMIELHNAGNAPAVLDGWGLTDNSSLPFKYTFAGGTTLAAGAYLVIYANGGASVPLPRTTFGIKDSGDTITLTKSSAQGGGFVDAVAFGAQIADYSIGRRLTDGGWDMCRPTLGAPNIVAAQAGLSGLKINEWLADAVTLIGQDFVELYNPNALPVNIGNCFLSDNPIEYPNRHQIRQLTFLAPGGYTFFKADGDVNQGPEHLNFKLDPLQGEIGFFTPDLAMLDNLVYGPQSSDVSEGRTPNGASAIAFFNQPTPGAPNPGSLGTVGSTVALMSPTQVWKYYANATAGPANDASGRAFTHPLFTDTAWPSGGGVLYIESSVLPTNSDGFAKTTTLPGLTTTKPYQTYYFRTHFTFNGPLAGASLTAKLICDDGCLIYLNGQEITPTSGSRIRMDAGAATYTTLTTGQGPDASAGAACYETFTFSNAQLVVGDNVLAVEVHQVNDQGGAGPSSDITWGLKLDANIVSGSATVVLNEVLPINATLTNPDGSHVGWIELINTSGASMDISDMSLSNDVSDPRKFIIPAGTSISANSYRVIYCNGLLPSSVTNTHFDLTGTGGGVYLFNTLADGGGLLDSVNYGQQVPDYSIGRTPNGSGPFALNVPSRGALNQAAGLGAITGVKCNEWLVTPIAGPGWFEIFNTGAQPVSLSGNYFTDNLSDRTKYQIPPLTFAGGSGSSRWQQWLADENNGADYGHVNFTLSSNQYLGLFAGNGLQLDARATESPAPGISQGLYADGNGVVISLLPTPGALNVPGPADTDGDGIPDDWELFYGLDPRSPVDADSDQDSDGMHNLLEFAFNLNPVKADVAGANATSGLPVAQLVSVPGGKVLEVNFLRRIATVGPGLDYAAAFSSGLSGWEPGMTPTVTPVNADWERVTVRDSAPAGSERRFVKVVITVNPPQ